MTKTKTGVYEWARNKVNIQKGCENGCRYCYARYNAVNRFKRMTPEEWLDPKVDNGKVDKEYPCMDGVTMLPTSHDITDRNINECLVVINRLLDAGNRILIVSKPRWSCIPLICESIKTNLPAEYMKRVHFRFTIGSVSDEVLKFWEPGAPGFEERLSCLHYAYSAGFETSVSCEPFLDRYPGHVWEMTIEYITNSFWIGLLRNFEQRVNMDGVTKEQEEKFVKPLKKLQEPIIIKLFYSTMKNFPKIRWKDSVRKIIDK